MQHALIRSMMAFTLIFALIIGLLPSGFAQASTGTVKVTKDGKALSFDVAPQIMNGRTMVPYRGIAEALGGTVKWDEKTKTVTVEKSGTTVKLTIDSKVAYKNNQRVNLDTAPVIVKGRTLVPVRFIGESLGSWVDWNATTRTVSIETSKQIKHAMGTTKLNKAPERVVVLFNGMVDIALELGVKPVGAVESWQQQPWYLYLRNEMGGVKSLGGDENQPNLEAIVALKPDLIIGSKLRHEKIYGQLSAIAPTVMTENVFDWKENMQAVAVALNKEAEADAYIKKWEARVADFKKKMGSKLNTKVSIVRFDPDHARIYYTGFAGTIFKELGLARPANQQQDVWGERFTSKEAIPQMDGDVIFNITSDWKGDGSSLKTQSEWTSHPLWKNLNAVKNGKVYDVNEIYYNMSGGARAANLMLDDLYIKFGLK